MCTGVDQQGDQHVLLGVCAALHRHTIVQTAYRHQYAVGPLEMHILASILWTSRVFFKLCCQELVHIAQNRRNTDSPATNSWPLLPFHSHFPSVPSPSLASLPSIRKLFFEKSRRVKTQFCKVNGNSNGSPRFLFYTIEDLAEICRTCKRKRSKALT